LRRLAFAVLLYVGAVLLLIRIASDRGPAGEGVPNAAIAVVGPAETVFDWSSQACGPEHIPDLPVRAFRDHLGRVQLILPHYVNRRMVGPSLDRVRVDCPVTMRSTRNPDPAAFDYQEWIASVFTRGGRNVAALVHEEYHGSQPGTCVQTDPTSCWYNAVTFARSDDGGRSFQQPPPPGQLVAASTYRYRPGVAPSGIFSPSNIVRNPDDGLYYAIVQAIEPEDEARGSCVMRTSNPASPSSWRAWDGDGFDLAFVDPYESAGTPEACEPIATAEISEMRESLTYNTHLDRFVLVGLSAARPQTDAEPVTGVYFSLSSDLIDWTPRKLVMEIESRQSFECGDADPIAYPSLLDPSSHSRTFGTTGRHPYLYYTQFHYNDCAQTLDRDLVRVPVEVSA
jgi:hypothetical protein